MLQSSPLFNYTANVSLLIRTLSEVRDPEIVLTSHTASITSNLVIPS